jgi:hypothetical protein
MVFKVFEGETWLIRVYCIDAYGLLTELEIKKEARTVLPVSTFSYQKSQLEYIMEGIGIQIMGIFKGHLLEPFGIF